MVLTGPFRPVSSWDPCRWSRVVLRPSVSVPSTEVSGSFRPLVSVVRPLPYVTLGSDTSFCRGLRFDTGTGRDDEDSELTSRHVTPTVITGRSTVLLIYSRCLTPVVSRVIRARRRTEEPRREGGNDENVTHKRLHRKIKLLKK